jgi:hypothetical protein
MNTSADGSLERSYRRLLALLPRRYRRDREQELLGVLLDTARPEQTRPSFAEVCDLLRLALRTWTLRLLGLDGDGGPAARRLLAWLLPSAMLIPASTWLGQQLLFPGPLFFMHRLTWETTWAAWTLWLAALLVLATGRYRIAGVIGIAATVAYLAVLVHFALRSNPRTVVDEVGWVVIQVVACLALLTAPNRPSVDRSPRRSWLPAALVASALLGVGFAHGLAMPRIGAPQALRPVGDEFVTTADLTAVAVGLLMLSTRVGRILLPFLAFAGIDLIAGRLWVSDVGDYGPGVPAWAHLQGGDILTLVLAPVIAFAVLRAVAAAVNGLWRDSSQLAGAISRGS